MQKLCRYDANNAEIRQKLGRNYPGIVQQSFWQLCRNYAEIRQKLGSSYAEIMYILCKLCRSYAEIMQKICIYYAIYAEITHKLCKKNYAEMMQILCKIMQIMQNFCKLCKNYANQASLRKLCNWMITHPSPGAPTGTLLIGLRRTTVTGMTTSS